MELNEVSNFELSSVAVESEECVVCVCVTSPSKGPGKLLSSGAHFRGNSFLIMERGSYYQPSFSSPTNDTGQQSQLSPTVCPRQHEAKHSALA